MRHIWKETGEVLSHCTDPVTTRERCETCGSLCWHYQGVRGFRYRSTRDSRIGEVTPEQRRLDRITPDAPVLNDEPCVGRLLSPEEAVAIPNPQQPINPKPTEGGIVAGPRKLKATWGDRSADGHR